jgi:hypothetical protein
MSIKIFNKLPTEIKGSIHDSKQFKEMLINFFIPILFIQYRNILITKISNCIVFHITLCIQCSVYIYYYPITLY